MARLLNRAYERLNRVLSLAGSQAVNDIDLSTVFPTQDMRRIALAQLRRRFRYKFNDSAVGAGTEYGSVRPWIVGDWSEVLDENGVAVTEVPNPRDFDYFLMGGGIGVSATAPYDTASFYLLDRGFSAGEAAVSPLSASLNVAVTLDGTGLVGARPHDNDVMWVVPLPYLLPTNDFVRPSWRMAVTGAVDYSIYMDCLIIPKGLISPNGS